MKIAVSNIAWAAEDETSVAETLQTLGVRSVEIAPTKCFPDPTSTSSAERSAYANFWAGHDIEIVAFQSMLFGRPDLQVFGESSVRHETVGVLSRFIELAGALGAGRLVFGSPKNRIVPEGMSSNEAQDLALSFFTALGVVAHDNNTLLCLEPNPTDYGCNFVTNTAAGLALVQAVDNPGFALHLDAAGMTLAGDDLKDSIRSAGYRLAHFHASAPQLGPLENEIVDHAQASTALREMNYGGYVSIEMRPGKVGAAAAAVSAAVALARKEYNQIP